MNNYHALEKFTWDKLGLKYQDPAFLKSEV